MFVSASTERSLDLIAARASDLYRAFTPGATPASDDVATSVPESRRVFNPLSVTLPDNDFFVTSDERGRTTYTRDGSLRVTDGILAGENGRPILGYARGEAALSELHVDPVDAALGRVRNMRIERDGSVAYERRVIDPRSGADVMQRVDVGRLALARFPAATKLTPADVSTSSAPAGVVPHVGRPGDGNFSTLEPLSRESSRIDLNASLDRLHDAYVAFDALQAAHKAQGSTGKIAMDLLK